MPPGPRVALEAVQHPVLGDRGTALARRCRPRQRRSVAGAVGGDDQLGPAPAVDRAGGGVERGDPGGAGLADHRSRDPGHAEARGDGRRTVEDLGLRHRPAQHQSGSSAGSTPRSASAREVTATATSRLETSASVPCHFANGDDHACTEGDGDIGVAHQVPPRTAATQSASTVTSASAGHSPSVSTSPIDGAGASRPTATAAVRPGREPWPGGSGRRSRSSESRPGRRRPRGRSRPPRPRGRP